MANSVIIRKETLEEIKKILNQIKEQRLINRVMTGLEIPANRYVKFDALCEKVDNLLRNTQK